VERRISLATFYDQETAAVILKISDEGTGIAPEHVPHLTDPFFTTKRESGGTGLGLSVSATIVKEHGGSLEFDSNPGKGAVVTLSLPCSRRT
jgi:polar amino acid transport system substrate-binding protein